MYKEFFLVPSIEYSKLVNKSNKDKIEHKENTVIDTNKNLEDKSLLEDRNVDPKVLLKIYERLNKLERNKQEINNIEETIPVNISQVQRADGIKLISYLKDKRLVDVDANGNIHIPDTNEKLSDFLHRNNTKAPKPLQQKTTSVKTENKYFAFFSPSTPDDIRNEGIEMINLLQSDGVIDLGIDGVIRLINSHETMGLDDFLRSVFIGNAPVRKYLDFLKHIIGALPNKYKRNEKLKALKSSGGKIQNTTNKKNRHALPYWIYL